jgi:two-component system LytT family response regulator
MQIKSLIIDDDPFIHDLLLDKLHFHLPEVLIANDAYSGEEGLKMIQTYQPDLIFLDVEMTDMTGFEMLRRVPEITFQTIFITSYSHYAIKAIRFNALDYLVKPIDLEELKEAIQRYKSSNDKSKNPETLQHALENMRAISPSEQTILLRTSEGEVRILLKDIIRLEGERNYTVIYLLNKKKKIVSKTLSEFEELLSEKGFFRCHKSNIVNIIHIHKILDWSYLTLSDATEIQISRRKKATFREWHESYNF